MAPTPKLTLQEKRDIKKKAELKAKAEAKAEEEARQKEQKRIQRRSRTSSHTRLGISGSTRPIRVHNTNIYNTNPIYGDFTVTGNGNQVAYGNEGDVQQEIGEQNITEQPVDPATAQLAARTLLHELHTGGIEVDDPEVAEELRAEAEELEAEAGAEEPDQGTLKRLATTIGGKLTTITTTGVSGFLAQLLASVFLPPVS